jgi:predicted RNA binding protein YcfA (HicA-like mRNA interferase family)
VKLPRDVSGPELVKALAVLGYQPTRQKESHIQRHHALEPEVKVAVPDSPAHAPAVI